MSSMDEVRKRVAEIGKEAAITEEMLRLGFISEDDLASRKVKQN